MNGDAGQVGTPLTLSGGGLLTLNSDGSYRFEPGEAYAALKTGEQTVETVRYTLSDRAGLTAEATLNLTITGQNSAPTLDADKTIYVDQYSERKPDAGNRFGLSITDPVDSEGDTLSVQITAVPEQGTVSKQDGTVVKAGDLISQNDLAGLQYAPPVGQNGEMGAIGYSVSDSVDVQARAVRIVVKPVQYLDISADQTVVTEGNSGSTPVQFTVTRSGDSSQAATVRWSVKTDSGIDAADLAEATALNGEVQFAAGETRQTLTLNLRGDNQVEPSESLRIQLDEVTVAGGTDGTAAVDYRLLGTAALSVIQNDDAAPQLLGVTRVVSELGDIYLSGDRVEFDASFDQPVTAGKDWA